ncbi:hypothetical protein HanIR_Chr15g0760751 [Helianthus annuus]|nr:hypothetical protein HanIR_Chr15g0760751 [Helianthus annuus]
MIGGHGGMRRTGGGGTGGIFRNPLHCTDFLARWRWYGGGDDGGEPNSPSNSSDFSFFFLTLKTEQL